MIDNLIEVKVTVTMCKLTQLEVYDSKDDYKLESDFESSASSDIDEKRRQLNREAVYVSFDPEKQNTRYNTKALPSEIPVIEINEKPTETADYHWLTRYESIPSNSPFNKFLNKFKKGEFAPKVAEFQGVRYRFFRVGTNARINTVRQYNQFIIGNNFTVFCLGVNGSPNVDIGVNARARERCLPPPINKKFSISSLFWANGLLKSQKAWYRNVRIMHLL